jgi:hypothetical protein
MTIVPEKQEQEIVALGGVEWEYKSAIPDLASPVAF